MEGNEEAVRESRQRGRTEHGASCALQAVGRCHAPQRQQRTPASPTHSVPSALGNSAVMAPPPCANSAARPWLAAS